MLSPFSDAFKMENGVAARTIPYPRLASDSPVADHTLVRSTRKSIVNSGHEILRFLDGLDVGSDWRSHGILGCRCVFVIHAITDN